MVATRSTGAPLAAFNDAIDRMRRSRRWRKRYKPSDVAHRHRLADRQPKTVEVTTHRRRI